jgi:hypothetical protein
VREEGLCRVVEEVLVVRVEKVVGWEVRVDGEVEMVVRGVLVG